MKKWIIVALTAAFLISCRPVGPNYSRPLVKPPDTFRGADRSSASDPASLADLKWFELFKDPALQRLIRAALEQNYDLRNAVARVNAARANLGITRADQYPGIAANTAPITPATIE